MYDRIFFRSAQNATDVSFFTSASRRLPNSHKTVYLRQHRYLRKTHPYRKMKVEFDGTAEAGVGPRPYEGEVVHNMAKNLCCAWQEPPFDGETNTQGSSV